MSVKERAWILKIYNDNNRHQIMVVWRSFLSLVQPSSWWASQHLWFLRLSAYGFNLFKPCDHSLRFVIQFRCATKLTTFQTNSQFLKSRNMINASGFFMFLPVQQVLDLDVKCPPVQIHDWKPGGCIHVRAWKKTRANFLKGSLLMYISMVIKEDHNGNLRKLD